MIFDKCTGCNQIKELVTGKLCALCVEELKNSFHYGIGGKEVSKTTYDRIVKRGSLIPEEIEDVRLEEEEWEMYYCSNCDIAHESRNCPLCAAQDEIKDLKSQIEKLEEEKWKTWMRY